MHHANDEDLRASAEGRQVDSRPLDRVREILIGSQMRAQEQNLARFEERMLRVAEGVREELCRRVDELSRQMADRVGVLRSELESEKSGRTDATAQIHNEIEQLQRLHREEVERLRDESIRAQGRFQAELQERCDQLRREIEAQQKLRFDDQRQSIETLRFDKMDRVELASLLAELAMRLDEQPLGVDGVTPRVVEGDRDDVGHSEKPAGTEDGRGIHRP